MKTINQIVEEYKNKQNNTVYAEIGVLDVNNSSFTFNDIRNFTIYPVNDIDIKGSTWLEFDSKWENKDRHIKMLGEVIRYVEFIPTITNTAPILQGDGKQYKKIVVCTHSGQRETFENVSNIAEDKKNRIVEFDTTGIRLSDAEGYQKLHVIKNPGSLEHSMEIIK